MEALKLGGDAITDIAHEVLASNVESSSTGSSFAMPIGDSSIASGRGTTITKLQHVEHWTAKIIARGAKT
jgi:hypothetical protein